MLFGRNIHILHRAMNFGLADRAVIGGWVNRSQIKGRLHRVPIEYGGVMSSRIRKCGGTGRKAQRRKMELFYKVSSA